MISLKSNILCLFIDFERFYFILHIPNQLELKFFILEYFSYCSVNDLQTFIRDNDNTFISRFIRHYNSQVLSSIFEYNYYYMFYYMYYIIKLLLYD